jgi:predicted acetyltransferase
MVMPNLSIVTNGEWSEVADLLEHAFGQSLGERARSFEKLLFDPKRSLVAYDGACGPIGHASSYAMRMRIPGGAVNAAAVCLVGVLPTHRRQGVLSTLMRHQLNDIYEYGREPVAILQATEAGIYGRFGYGIASEGFSVEVARCHNGLRPVSGTDEVPLRPAVAGEVRDLIADIRETALKDRPGSVKHDAALRTREVMDTRTPGPNFSGLRCVLAQRENIVTGYALYCTYPRYSVAIPEGRVRVRRVHALDLASYIRLWMFLLDQDLMALTTHDHLPGDDPLLNILEDVRAAKAWRRDGLWLRVVDVEAALSKRSYACPVDVVIAVRDRLCAWNAGRWHREGDRRGGSCRRCKRGPDIALDVRELGALYLGRPSAVALSARRRLPVVDWWTAGRTRTPRSESGTQELLPRRGRVDSRGSRSPLSCSRLPPHSRSGAAAPGLSWPEGASR